MAIISPDHIARLRDQQTGVINLRLQELEVCEYWGVIFSDHGIATLTKQDIMGFLSYKQNHRWREISKEDVTADMPRLRAALSLLTNDTIDLAVRLNALEPGRGSAAVPHLGKAKLTPILLVTNPKRYGVWNDYSERALTSMGLFPSFASATLLGEQYCTVNDVLLALADKYRLSLWRLDIILEQIARVIR